MKILSAKEQAAAIGRSPSYISAMRKAGFPNFVTTPRELVEWLKKNPQFRKKKVYKNRI